MKNNDAINPAPEAWEQMDAYQQLVLACRHSGVLAEGRARLAYAPDNPLRSIFVTEGLSEADFQERVRTSLDFFTQHPDSSFEALIPSLVAIGAGVWGTAGEPLQARPVPYPVDLRLQALDLLHKVIETRVAINSEQQACHSLIASACSEENPDLRNKSAEIYCLLWDKRLLTDADHLATLGSVFYSAAWGVADLPTVRDPEMASMIVAKIDEAAATLPDSFRQELSFCHDFARLFPG